MEIVGYFLARLKCTVVVCTETASHTVCPKQSTNLENINTPVLKPDHTDIKIQFLYKRSCLSV